MSRLSVVVPVYNVENYLEDCLASLRTQTFEDIEIICVNDGSTDRSGEVLTACAEKDRRIRIIDKPNGGLSSARNAGILQACSPYVCFLDSDDRFLPEACEQIVSSLDESDADVLTFAARWVPEDGALSWLKEALSPRDAVYEGFDSALLFEEASRPFAWRTACRTDFLRGNGLLFDESVRFGEDQIFHFAIYPRSSKTVLSSQRLYEYRVDRPGSLMRSIEQDSFTRLSYHVDILSRVFDDWHSAGFMGLCPAELISFMVDFAAYDALKLTEDEYRAILDKLGPLIRGNWDEADIRKFDIRPVAKQIALEVLHGANMGHVSRVVLAYRYFVELHGVASVFRRILKGRE